MSKDRTCLVISTNIYKMSSRICPSKHASGRIWLQKKTAKQTSKNSIFQHHFVTHIQYIEN